MQRRGRLNFKALGITGFQRTDMPPPLDGLCVALTSLDALVLYLRILSTTYDFRTLAPIVCSGGPGLQLFTDLAHAFADTPAPGCGAPGSSAGKLPGDDAAE